MVDISQPRAPVAHTDGPEHRRQIANTVNNFINDAASRFGGIEQSIADNASNIAALLSTNITAVELLDGTQDLDDFRNAGSISWHRWNVGSQPANVPATAGAVLVIGTFSSDTRTTQIAVRRDTNEAWMRTFNGTSWSSWNQFVPAQPAPIFTQSFESSQQTITAGGALTLAHGLGVTPKLYMAVLQCVSANAGYSSGDETGEFLGVTSGVGTLIMPKLSIVPDATNMNIRYPDDGIVVAGKSTGARSAITFANWRLVVRAWA